SFSRHFNTNYVPTELEIQQIRTKLARLETLIRDLTSQCDKIKDYIDSHTALTLPARRLPFDLIQEIFLACLPTHRNAVMSTTEAPLLLSRICSEWRLIALEMPPRSSKYLVSRNDWRDQHSAR
ncbi:hypothetical protein DFH09DRAFT_947085, partial [Mycena vulgaris]